MAQFRPTRPTAARCALAAAAVAVALVAASCTGDDGGDVPEFTGSSSGTGSGEGDASSSPDGSASGEPTSTSVEVPAQDLPDDQAAVVAGLAAFMDDWMGVAGDPTAPVSPSEHATSSGQGVLTGVASTLTEAGNSIQGTLLVDDPSVSFAEVPTTASVTACFDQSGITLVALDGTELPGEDVVRVAGSASLVQTGDAWQVASLDIGADPC